MAGRDRLPIPVRLVLFLIFVPLALILIVAPLPFGSNRPLPWAVLGFAVGVLLLLWSAAALLPVHPVAGLPRGFWIAEACLALVVAVATLQTVTSIPAAWQHPFWRYTAGVLDLGVDGRISVNPFATGTATMRLLTYVGVFWLAFQLARWPRRAYRLLQVIAATGFGYAVYGLYVEAFDLKQVAFVPKWAHLDSLSSTFVNRNSYATYAGLGLLCALALLISGLYLDLRRLLGEGLPSRRRVAGVALRSAWLIPSATCLALALFLTDSRAGIASTGLGVVVLLVSLNHARVLPRVHMQGAVLTIVGVGLVAFLIVGQEAIERAATVEDALAYRLRAYERTLALIPGVGLLGTGYGTFVDIFRIHQGWDLGTWLWDHAHNTYLENALELGVPAATVLIIAIAAPAFWCFRSLLGWYGDPVFASLGLAATVLVGVHSLFDFSLEMAAVAVTYAAIMGAASAQTRYRPPPMLPGQGQRRFGGRRVLMPSLSAALGAVLPSSCRTCRRSKSSGRASRLPRAHSTRS